MIALGYGIIGILFLMVPHFLLPLAMLRGGGNAHLLAICSFWYHPEGLCGVVALAAAVVRFRYRRTAAFLAGFAAIAAVGQAIILRPTSYYLHSEEDLIILAQTISLRAHVHLRAVLLCLAGALLLLIIADILIARRRRTHVSLFVLAASNLRRKTFRTCALTMALAVVIGAFFTDVLLTRTIGNTLEVGVGRLGADLVVVPAGHAKKAQQVLLQGTPATFTLPAGVLARLKSWPQIAKLSPQLFFKPFSYLVCCIPQQVLLVGYDPATDFTIGPWVQYFLHGRQADNSLVVGYGVKFYPGQQISLFGHVLKVAASLDPTGIGYYDQSAFLPLSEARKLITSLKKGLAQHTLRHREAIEDLSLAQMFEAPAQQIKEMKALDPNAISAVFVKVRPGVDVRKLAAAIAKKIPGTTTVNVHIATTSIKRQLTSLLKAIFLPIVILMVMGMVILAATFGMSGAERQREIGMLRALGATRSWVFRLFLGESLCIAGLGAIFGVLGGGAIVILFKERIMAALHLLYIWPGPAVIVEVILLTLLVTVVMGVGAGLYPAIAAAKLEPYQAIRGR